jgi:hypothetical protein
MSIEEQRHKPSQEVLQLLDSLGPEAYAEGFQRYVYAEAFVERFPELAKTAWSDLLTLQPAVDAVIIPTLSKKSDSSIDQGPRLLRPIVDAWCERRGLSTRSGWFESVALGTLIDIAMHRHLGINPPSGFTFNRELHFERREDGVAIALEKMHLSPKPQALFYANPGVQVWNQSLETRAEFRRRAINEFAEILDRQIEALGPENFNPKTVEVNFAWVDWTILLLAEGKSVRSVAKQYHVTRPAVDKGVEKVREFLGFNEPRHTPAT